MSQTEKLKSLKAKMRKWQRESGNFFDIDIDDEGLANALLAAGEARKERDIEHEAVMFAHLVSATIGPDGSYLTNNQRAKRHLFEVISHERYRSMLNDAIDYYVTDEKPTAYMIELYKEFLEWEKAHPLTRKR